MCEVCTNPGAESTIYCTAERIENSEKQISFPCWVRLGGERGQARSWPGWHEAHRVMASRRKWLTQHLDYIKLREKQKAPGRSHTTHIHSRREAQLD